MAHCSLTFSLSSSYTHTICDGQGACVYVFLGGDSEEEVSHILGREQGQAEPFPWTAKSMDAGFHFLSQTHKKHFYARSNHITPCHHPSLGQSFLCPQSHILMLEMLSVFHKAISLVNSIFFPPVFFFSSPPSPVQSSSLPLLTAGLSPP